MSCCLSIQGRIHVGEWGLRVITVRICSKGLPCGANGLPRGWLGSANGLPRDCLWIACGLPSAPGIGPGIGKGLLCDNLGDTFGLPTYNSVQVSLCVFNFMFTRFNRVRGLARERFAITWRAPSACQGITERFPSKRLAIPEGLPLLLTADGLPVDCLGKQGCRLGIVQGYPWGFFSRLPRGNE